MQRAPQGSKASYIFHWFGHKFDLSNSMTFTSIRPQLVDFWQAGDFKRLFRDIGQNVDLPYHWGRAETAYPQGWAVPN